MSPVRGVPPSLEWVAVERLSVDESYQRDCDNPKSRKLISKIADSFDWALCQPLSVARREGGVLAVIDGQHRLVAAKLRGDLPHLPCIIVPSESVEQEANLFAKMNRSRKPLTSVELWRSQLVAGDPVALEAAELIERAGLTVAPYSNYTAWKPGVFGGLAAVVRGIPLRGKPACQMALVAIAEAFEGQVLRFGVSLFHSLLPLYWQLQSDPARFDPDLMIGTLSACTNQEWYEEAKHRSLREKRNCSAVLQEDIEAAYAGAAQLAREEMAA